MSHTTMNKATQGIVTTGRRVQRQPAVEVATMSTTWRPRDPRHDGSVLGEGRLSLVRIRQEDALRTAAAAREGERHRRTLRSRVGRLVMTAGVRIGGGAAGIGGAAAAGPATRGEVACTPRTA
jgi:hypothetical protein